MIAGENACMRMVEMGRNIVLTLETDATVNGTTPAGAAALTTTDCQVFILFSRTLTIMPSSNYIIAE
jgi:hypothetical protein